MRARLRRNPPPSLGVVPAGFTIDPLAWVEGTVLEDSVSAADAGFFHVTANLAGLRTTGELFSRRELQVATLGGGFRDESANRVSFHINLNRAQWMAALLRLVADPRVSFGKKVKTFLQFCEYPDDPAWGIPSDLDPDEDAEWMERSLAPMELATGISDVEMLLDPALLGQALGEPPTDEAAYEMLAAIDQALIEISMRNRGEDVCRPYLGLTAPWSQFKRVRPENIGIVQAAIREGATTDMNATECELRFLPRDIVLVSLDAERETMRVARDADDEFGDDDDE